MVPIERCLPFLLAGLLLAGAAQAGPRSYIVVLEDGVPGDEVEARADALLQAVRLAAPSLAVKEIARVRKVAGRNVTTPEKRVFRHVFRGFVVELDERDVAGLDALRSRPEVAFVAEDGRVRAFAQSTEPGMQRMRVPLNAIADVDGVDDRRVDADIAILDTGIAEHPDLNLHRSVSMISGVPAEGDSTGHGTHVAGIAAAIDNDIGVHGVAPGARLWSVKVLPSNAWGNDSDVIAGLDYVAAHADEIEVANMSIGEYGGVPDDRNCGRTSGDPMHLAVCGAVEAGVVLVAAAGNGIGFSIETPASTTRPARYDEVITVSAVRETDGLGPGALAEPDPADNRFWEFSNFGYDVDLAAPGADVYSTSRFGGYAVLSGTSMAAPAVAGAAALWIVKNGKPRNAKQVRFVRDELVRLSFPRNGFDNGFSHDRDHWGEPLLDVAPIDPIAGDSLEPRLVSDRLTYTEGQACPAAIVAFVGDERGVAVTGLPSNGFLPFVRGEPVEVAFRELGRGAYLLLLDVSGLAPDLYDFHVRVRNPAGFARTAGLQFVVRAETVPSLVVQSLEPASPILLPGSASQGFDARLAFEDGTPFTMWNGGPWDANETLTSTFSGGTPVSWSLPVITGWTYADYVGSASTADLGEGVYTLGIEASFQDLSVSARTAFAIEAPAPDLTAELRAGRTHFDFAQPIPPPELVLTVSVEDELLQPVTGLTSALQDPIAVSLDGRVLDGVEFEAVQPWGRYRSSGIDLAGLAHGAHRVSVEVVDTRGLVAEDRLEIEVNRLAVVPRPGLLIRPCPGTIQAAMRR